MVATVSAQEWTTICHFLFEFSHDYVHHITSQRWYFPFNFHCSDDIACQRKETPLDVSPK